MTALLPDEDFWPEEIIRQGCSVSRGEVHKAWSHWIKGRRHTVDGMNEALRKAGCDVPAWLSYGWSAVIKVILDRAEAGGLIKANGVGWEIF